MTRPTWIVALLAVSLTGAACSHQQTPSSSDRSPVSVGEMAPPFTLTSAGGDAVSLSDFARKPVLLYFSMGPG